MLGGLAAAFRTPDLRKKILFTLGLLAIYRLGTVIPTPGVDYTAIQKCVSVVQDNSLYGLINLFSGGALLQLSVFALGFLVDLHEREGYLDEALALAQRFARCS